MIHFTVLLLILLSSKNVVYPFTTTTTFHSKRPLLLLSSSIRKTHCKQQVVERRTFTNNKVSLNSVVDENNNSDDNYEDNCWNPKLRKVIGTIGIMGMAETSYLTYTKFTGGTAMCLSEATCSNVLNGPYAYIPGTEIPLSLLGLIAYTTATILALQPLIGVQQRNNDIQNRILLCTVTTTMGVFSIFLMSILFGVLHESCPYCVASAVFSIVMAKLTILGGALPKEKFKQGVQQSAIGGFTAFITAFVLFISNYDILSFPATGNTAAAVNVAGELVVPSQSSSSNTKKQSLLLAKATNTELQSPPPITTDSTETALQLAKELQSLDATFYGAFWCSHCYDQKQTLGKQAMDYIPYIECSPQGLNSQTKLCKSKQVPGYPTWEIAGKLYPGEQAVEELQDIVSNAKIGN